MLAKTIAILVVTLAVIGPGIYLLRVAWYRGGIPRKVAGATLFAIFTLIAWLFAPGSPGVSEENRISEFVGAWGILFIVVGLVVIAAAAFGKFRPPD
jgi:hypothetical protein